MMKRPRRGMWGLLGTILLAGVAQAQPAHEILERTASTYRTLQAYHVEGTVRIVMEAAGQQRAMDLKLMMAERRPDLLYAEVDGAMMQLQVVADGASTWIYMPAANQYIKQEGLTRTVLSAGVVPDLVKEYSGLADSVRSASILKEETLRLAHEERPSVVLSVAYQPRHTPAGVDSTYKTIWVDKERYVVLREQTRAYVTDVQTGRTTLVEETTRFSRVQVGGVPNDSLFVFEPPRGAVEVTPEEVAMGGAVRSSSNRPGDPATAFTLQNLSGDAVSLASLRGKVVLVNFWATWCGPCRVEMPMLERFYQQYADRGLVVLAVDLSEPAAAVQEYVDTHGYTFPILLDTDGIVANRYGVSALPSTFIIDRDGTLVRSFAGIRAEEVLLGTLRDAGLETD